MANFQSIDGQFTTNNYSRTTDFDPPFVVELHAGQIFMFVVGYLVVSRIKHLDNLTVFVDRVWNPNLVSKALSDSLSQSGFSVPRLAVKKKSGA